MIKEINFSKSISAAHLDGLVECYIKLNLQQEGLPFSYFLSDPNSFMANKKLLDSEKMIPQLKAGSGDDIWF